MFVRKKKCDNEDGETLAHAVSIVGQRCVNGRIEYQIQNSWGKTCNPYVKNGKYLFNCDPKTGLIWIPENKLLMNLFNISVLNSDKNPIPKIEPMADDENNYFVTFLILFFCI